MSVKTITGENIMSGKKGSNIDVIYNIVSEWCKERNSANHVRPWILGSAMVMVISLLCYFFLNLIPMLLSLAVFAVAFAVLSFHSSKIERPDLYRGRRQNWHVPDTLLIKLADSSEIPLSGKRWIADFLKKEGRITFEFLFHVEEGLAHDSAKERPERRPGFKKMTAFSSNDGESLEQHVD